MTKLEEKITQLRLKEQENRAKQLAEKFDLPYLDLKTVPIERDALALVPETKAKKAKLAVIQIKVKKIVIAVQNPDDPQAKKIISDLRKEYQVKTFVCSIQGLKKAWAVYKEIPKEAKEITGKVEIEKASFEKLRKEIENLNDIKEQIEKLAASDASTVVEVLLAGGLQTDASDVHLETSEQKVDIRYRIDGLLQDVVFLSPKTYKYVLNRLKLLAGMKLNITDQAQDGRFTISVDKADVEVRVSDIPSAYGENIVMRILNPKAIRLELKDLGLRADLLDKIQTEIKKPNGMIITTGPTGSGKTTLLYALIKTVSRPEIKIITLEDPIEYHLEEITQTQVQADKGYTFAKGLRAILRQDPDVVLVGEIRDKETAEIATQAALTGHLVLSTLHTNDAAGAIPRFLDIGVNPSSVAAGLNVIIAQRLIRRLCEKCKKEISPTNEQIKKIKKVLENLPKEINYPAIEKTKFYKPVGCSKCNGLGFKGRIGIFEMILINEKMEQLISAAPSHIQILQTAKEQGMVSFYQDGILKVLDGITTIEEVERIASQ